MTEGASRAGAGDRVHEIRAAYVGLHGGAYPESWPRESVGVLLEQLARVELERNEAQGQRDAARTALAALVTACEAVYTTVDYHGDLAPYQQFSAALQQAQDALARPAPPAAEREQDVSTGTRARTRAGGDASDGDALRATRDDLLRDADAPRSGGL